MKSRIVSDKVITDLGINVSELVENLYTLYNSLTDTKKLSDEAVAETLEKLDKCREFLKNLESILTQG